MIYGTDSKRRSEIPVFARRTLAQGRSLLRDYSVLFQWIGTDVQCPEWVNLSRSGVPNERLHMSVEADQTLASQKCQKRPLLAVEQSDVGSGQPN
jgi:hypothetical protein